MSKKLKSLTFIDDIKEIINRSRNVVFKNINIVMVRTNWLIGKRIVEEEQKGELNSKYGDYIVKKVSLELTKQFGKGYSKTNIKMYRRFYSEFRIGQTLSDQLSWSHYVSLLGISDKKERSFYMKECINSNWSVRELQRQIDSCLYQRILNASDNKSKKIEELSKKGIDYKDPNDFIKDPMVLEFLGVDSKIHLESDLEKSIINHIEEFLLELGKGFMFVGSQQRIILTGITYYVDMVFYNKILKSYVLIDLKMNKLKPDNFGQMNMYVNYYKNEVNDKDDNDPIGLILCADKEMELAKLSKEGISNKIYTAKYTSIIPRIETLQNEVYKVVDEYKQIKKYK